MNPRRLLFLFLGALTVFRLVYITQLELFPDEAYYLQWSQHLDLSYFSKGPGIALALWLSTHLFGPTVFGIRVLSPLLALATSLLMFSFTRRIYGETIAVWTVLVLSFAPIYQIGALVMTIDPLSIFFWMAALYTFWLALEKSPAFNGWWPATGALIGLGFLAKYTNAMQLLSILLLLALTPKYRRELCRPGFYTMLGVFALFTTPVIVWNAQHAWITLLHLRERGGLDSGPRFNPLEFLTFLGLHLGVYSPLIFGAMLAAVVWAWKKSRAHFKPRFLMAFTLPLFVMYFALSFKRAGEPNWTAPATLSLAILTVVYWLELAQEKKWARTYAVAGLALGGIVSVLAIDTDMVRRAGLPLSHDADPSARARGWHTTGEKIEEIRNAYEAEHGEKVFLIANKYGTAASIGFYLPHPRREMEDYPPVFVPESAWPENQFYFWPRYDGLVDYTDAAREKLRPGSDLDPAVRAELAAALEAMPTAAGAMPSEEVRLRFLHALKAAAPELGIDDYYTESFGYSPFVGRTALYITDRDDESKPPDVFARTFAHSEMIACFNVLRRGTSLRQIRVFACTGYHLQEL
ncbi:MAG: glycosyltransferase family 39 protein [Chthoniobacter sp.]|nr:glycosyltransferase family 39 protein [Chthoniobacter sp.]